MNDIVLNKAEIIERALSRVKQTYARHAHDLDQAIDAQDVIVLNLQRACEAAIDLAMHIVRIKGLGLPKDSKSAFDLLSQAGEISTELAGKLKKMVGFRNIAVHDYRELDWEILVSIVQSECDDLAGFASQMVKKHG
ncbi:MAG: DUF86 domain-containing protein [Gallionellaceae bacterium]|nr:MAG: DUF86 domain-containing protein [Gallionellaceae bacterium]